MAMSPFQETGLRFRNAAKIQVREISVVSRPVGEVLESCRLLFDLLDRGDPYQASLCRKLWVLRTTILFTLLPFDSAEQGLLMQLNAIAEETARIPGAIAATEHLTKAVHVLLEHPDNPKYLRIRTLQDHATEASPSSRTGFLATMAMGRSFGWPMTADGRFDVVGVVNVIDSRKALAESVFNTVIVPGTCHYLSTSLYTELFHQGRAGAVHILLYPGERFALRQRLTLPDSQIFRGRLTTSRIACMRESGSAVDMETDTDDRMKEGFWQVTHDGRRTPVPGHRAARYVLCGDGRGLFVPEDAHVLVWRVGDLSEDSELESIPVDRLAEGDWLVMKPSNTGYLLDLESAEDGFGKKMEEACDWRPALVRLLLTVSPEDLAEQMQVAGARGLSLAQSIRNWADGSVYGPGSQNELRVLLLLLIRHGKLPPPDDMGHSVAVHWQALQELRGIRHRAGHNVRREIHCQLSNALEHLGCVDEAQPVLLEGGVRVQLCQVAALDDQTSWVPTSRLLQLQPMKGGRWQE